MTGPAFTTIEVQAYRPGAATGTARYSWGSRSWGARMPAAVALEDTTTVRASDVGYRTEVVAGDVINYPALLLEAADIDRHLELDPASSAAPATWGRARLINESGRYDQLATDYSCDSRMVTIKMGRRVYDRERALLKDPASTTLSNVFVGLAESWRLSETQLEIPLRDASYWLDRPYLQNAYTGAGGLGGSADLAGQTIPRVRGGNAANPVRGVQPLLIDPINRIYQYTDGAGSVVTLYENAAAVFTNAGNVADLYVGTTPAGQYRTDNARGLIQLGSAAVGLITADVFGAFPVFGATRIAATIARYIIAEDMALPAALFDAAAFNALASPFPYTCGWYWPSGDQSTGAQAVGLFLRSISAKLAVGRDGRMRPILLRSVAANAVPVASLTTAHILRLSPNQLPAPLDPPAYRWRVGYRRNHTVQTTGLNAGTTEEQRRAARQEWQTAAWSSPSIQAAYARPSDPDLLPTALLVQSDAQLLANAIGAQWGTRARLYDIELPEEIAMTLDLGSVVRVTWPAADLRSGRLGQVVGEQRRAGQTSVTLQVLF